jgi:CheY-like chemotaxis protein
VSLPEVSAAAREVGEPPSAPPQTEDLARHCILVVDDFQESADTVASTLRSLGQDATALYDPRQVVDWALQHPPDVIFLDIAMPGLDGYELARRIRSHDPLRGTLLVALTGYGQPEDRRRALAAGIDLYLTKPTTRAELHRLLRDSVARKHATAGAL